MYAPNDKRASWDPHGIQGFYLGPALLHYRCMAIYIPNTEGIRISDQCQFFPKHFKFPGASTNEILLKSVDDLNETINNNATELLHNQNLTDAIEHLENAIEIFKSNVIPPGPQSPDGVNDSIPLPEINPIIDSTIIENTPTDTHPIINNNLPIESERVLYDTHRLRSVRAITPKNDQYRKLTPKESKKKAPLKHRIGQHWTDTDTNEEFVINSVIMPNKKSGEGSKTAYYSFYNISQ